MQHRQIYGQEKPLAALDAWRARVGVVPHFNGIADMVVLAGPPACGKRTAADVIAAELGEETLHLHMGEYAFADDISRLTAEKGLLRTWVCDHPDGCVIFEAIDEADHAVQKALAAIVTDGDEASRYRRAVFIFIFKVKDPDWSERDFLDRYYSAPLLHQARFYEALSQTASPTESGTVHLLFDPELLNVFSKTDLILFYPLGLKTLQAIARDLLVSTAERLNAQRGIKIAFEHDEALTLGMLLGFSPYLNSERITHHLPARVFDLIRHYCPKSEQCLLTVSDHARAWLASTFAADETIKSFGKFDRRFHLEWERLIDRHHCKITLKSIEEKAQERPSEREPDQLRIHAVHPVSFDAIAGQKRVKQQLLSFVSLLHDIKGMHHFRITPPKGLLLYGPEGVGKTMLIKAFAKAANLPYLYLHDSDLFDEQLIREAYHRARTAAPMIVMIENVDIKGFIDGGFTPIPTEALCTMIDLAPDEPERYVFTVMTAKSKEEVPAELMHTGRIDQFVEVPELDRDARRFFADQLLEIPHEPIDPERITRYMTGMNGYELGRIAKASALEALKEGRTRITEPIVIDQINTIKYGSRIDIKRIKNFEEDLKQSAYHEAAHAVATLLLLPDIEIEQVTVIPRSEVLGLVSYAEEHLQANVSAEEIRGNIAVALAGRLATVKAFGKARGMESGAYGDLQQATRYAFSAVALYGMDETLENISLELLLQNVSNTLFAEKLENRIAAWIDEGKQTASEIIDTYWGLIDSLARRLVKEEFIEGEELKILFEAFKGR